jgi:dolichyl-phosphate beta-glucosyltransferase
MNIERISIVMPAYNEEKRIGKSLEQIKNYIAGKKESFEIIVVDDGSSDGTVKVVEEFDLDVKIIKSEKNMGKGNAIKKGMLAATGDVTLFMDSDASADIREFEKFYPYLEEHDVVVGSRKLHEDSIVVSEGFLRRTIGLWGHKLIDVVIRSDVKDLLCAFKMYSKKAREEIFKKQISNGMASDYEAIFLAEKLGFKIKELPIKWEHQEGGTAKPSWYVKALKELFMVRVNNFFGRYN